jgi:hypothetical protein
MAHDAMWYFTELPVNVVDLIIESTKDCSKNFSDGILYEGVANKGVRDSKVAWIPTANWIASFIWFYIEKANRENFHYDLIGIDGESLQYTVYTEGQFYGWHKDYSQNQLYLPEKVLGAGTYQWKDEALLKSEKIRKLSFSLQLSDYTDYKGGELQFLQNKRTFFAPKTRGTLCIFDSELPHRVRKIKWGERKSLVGWVVGPRWR